MTHERDEFRFLQKWQLKVDALLSDGMGQATADEYFDKVFKRTTNVQFLCGDFK